MVSMLCFCLCRILLSAFCLSLVIACCSACCSLFFVCLRFLLCAFALLFVFASLFVYIFSLLAVSFIKETLSPFAFACFLLFAFRFSAFRL